MEEILTLNRKKQIQITRTGEVIQGPRVLRALYVQTETLLV